MSVRHIHSVNDTLYLVCQLTNSLRYDKHYNSYVVSASDNFITIGLEVLQYKHPVYAVLFDREIHVVIHHYSCVDFDYCKYCI